MQEPLETGRHENIYESEAKKDESIDLTSLVKKAKAVESATPVESEPQATVTGKKLSPLEQMALTAEKNRGMSITKEEYENGKEKPLKDFSMNDNRSNAIQDRVNDFDTTLEKRKAVVVLKSPENAQEYTQMMYEIDCVKLDENGKATGIDCRNGNEEPVEPMFIRLRTPEDPEFSEGKDEKLLENAPETTDAEEAASEENADEVHRKSIVNILIDKTGFGADFKFTDEEREKIFESQELRLTEVEVLDLETINAKTTDKSFQETIHEYELSNSKTTICFPASGFRAQMKGLTYGEMSDITLSMENVTVDQYYKRMSIIYNKMTNISCGPFDSFEDFLKKFAYIDIPLALYGLYVSTQPEVQQIQLRCGNPNCKHTFNASFSTRSILSLGECNTNFLEKMKEIATAPAVEYDNLKHNSAVENSKFIKLPYSGFVVEMGIISSYEFLYNFLPMLDEKTVNEVFGNDVSDIYMNNILFLTTVRSIRVPNSDGTYAKAEGYKDILDAIYNITMPEEIKILGSIANKLTTEYQSVFELRDVTCPHCKNVTKSIDVSMDDLVFQTYQRLMNTSINVENIQGL